VPVGPDWPATRDSCSTNTTFDALSGLATDLRARDELLAGQEVGTQAYLVHDAFSHVGVPIQSFNVQGGRARLRPSISGCWLARMFVAWSKLNRLKSYAVSKGYEEPEVRAFMKDPVEKARVNAMAADYLTSHGAVAGNAESYCTLGREEIAKKSLIGQMLRAR